MIKILTIIGTRPQFIKSVALSLLFEKNDNIIEVIVNTGQHYDFNLSNIFLEELKLPEHKYNLKVGSKSHAKQTAYILNKLDKIIDKENPNFLLLYGDTNSTLSGALAACKKNVKIVHVEAGLRSFNKYMPEEINRLLTDHISDQLFVPSIISKNNLIREGIDENKITITGDILKEITKKYKNFISNKFLETRFAVKPKNYILTTIHRQENTDDHSRFEQIILQLLKLSDYSKILFPIHPRSKEKINRLNINLSKYKNFKMIEPLGYLEMLCAQKNSMLTITDSGGVQRESIYLGVPTIVVRNESEWVEIIEQKASILTDPNNIFKSFKIVKKQNLNNDLSVYGKDNVATQILSYFLNHSESL